MKRTRIKKLGSELDRRIQDMRATSLLGASIDELERRVAEIDAIAMPIIGKPARSLAELAVKAKVAFWLSGDFLSEDTLAEAAAASIIRDLIRLH